MRARLAVHQDGPQKANSESPMKGITFPYVSKHGFPVFFFENDEIQGEYHYIDVFAGMVGCSMRGGLYAADVLGDIYSLGLTMPARLEPQPLEVDPNHPFFAAAQRGLEKATQET